MVDIERRCRNTGIIKSDSHNVAYTICLVQDAAAELQLKLGDPAAIFLVSAGGEGKVSMVAAFSPAVVKGGLQAGKFVGAIAKICGGNGGGRPNLAQAGAKDASKIPEALAVAREQLGAAL